MKKLIANVLMGGGAGTVLFTAINLSAGKRNAIFAGLAAAAFGFIFDKFIKGEPVHD